MPCLRISYPSQLFSQCEEINGAGTLFQWGGMVSQFCFPLVVAPTLSGLGLVVGELHKRKEIKKSSSERIGKPKRMGEFENGVLAYSYCVPLHLFSLFY